MFKVTHVKVCLCKKKLDFGGNKNIKIHSLKKSSKYLLRHYMETF